MILLNPSFFRFFFPWILWKGPSDRREIVLTFDDGPHPVYTPSTLEILRQHQAKAVFFLNGRNVLSHPGIVEKLKKEGHLLGVHGHSHQKLDFRKREFILEEVGSSLHAVEKITGAKPEYFRPPYGRFDLRFKKIMSNLSLRLVLWSLLTRDFREVNPDVLVRTVRTRIHNGALLVFHDGHRNAPVMLKALPEILNTLRRLGYEIQTLDKWTN